MGILTTKTDAPILCLRCLYSCFTFVSYPRVSYVSSKIVGSSTMVYECRVVPLCASMFLLWVDPQPALVWRRTDGWLLALQTEISFGQRFKLQFAPNMHGTCIMPLRVHVAPWIRHCFDTQQCVDR